MRERITQHCGALPAPVLSKLLDVEAGELDTWLNYPKGIQAKAGILCRPCTQLSCTMRAKKSTFPFQ